MTRARSACPVVLAVPLLVAGSALAQPASPAAPGVPSLVLPPHGMNQPGACQLDLVDCPPCANCVPGSRFWGDVGYLLWWVKPGPLPVPLVTTGSDLDPLPSVIGQPGTAVLFGNRNLEYGTFSGLRLTAGMWLTPEANVGGRRARLLAGTASSRFHLRFLPDRNAHSLPTRGERPRRHGDGVPC